MEGIYFYEKTKGKGPSFFEFSNYYPHSFTVDGVTYPSSEHYYQSQKFAYPGASEESLDYSRIIASAKTPNMSRILALQKTGGGYPWRIALNEHIEKSLKNNARCDPHWELRKDNIMRKAVYLKFSQDKKLENLLLSTFPKPIFEDSPRDSYWGIGKDHKGKNRLGQILEEVRYILLVLERKKRPDDLITDVKVTMRRKADTYIPPLMKEEILPSPFAKASWLVKGALLGSSYPGERETAETKAIIDDLLEGGITIFIDLTEKQKEGLTFYTDFLKKDTDYYNFPIVDRRVTVDKEVWCLALAISFKISQGDAVLIHCKGGKGRTGTLTSIILGIVYGMNERDALEYAHRTLHLREDIGRAYPKAPQTKLQFDQVSRIYREYLPYQKK